MKVLKRVVFCLVTLITPFVHGMGTLGRSTIPGGGFVKPMPRYRSAIPAVMPPRYQSAVMPKIDTEVEIAAITRNLKNLDAQRTRLRKNIYNSMTPTTLMDNSIERLRGLRPELGQMAGRQTKLRNKGKTDPKLQAQIIELRREKSQLEKELDATYMLNATQPEAARLTALNIEIGLLGKRKRSLNK